jgi:DNA polymerase (family 10)
MENKALADILDQIGDLLDIKGEQVFRVNAYRKAARALRDLPRDATAMLADGALAEVPGIGKGMLEKIREYVEKGKIHQYEELIASMPPGLPALLEIPGMGPKTVAHAWEELGVDGIDALKRVIESGELAHLKGMGEKSVAQIKAGLEFLERRTGRTPLGQAMPIARSLLEAVRRLPGVREAEAAGSLRRGLETIGDIDILCAAPDGQAVTQCFVKLPEVTRVLVRGDTKASVLVVGQGGNEIQVDLRVVPKQSFGAALQYFTGSKEHNVRLREMAVKRKWKLNEWGLHDARGRQLAGESEESIYKRLGLPCFPPEIREDRGEFETAEELPDLIERSDVRGDFHMHTTASDGTVTALEMAKAACDLDYHYLAITDHSKSSGVANGLTVDRMWRQIEKLRELNRQLKDITILVGCECDILADGELDYSDTLLAACDLIIASIHSGLRQDRKKITQRLIRAMENPYVTIIAHPTGRLINRREPADLDIDAVIAAAARTHTALEINSSWQRLDLNDRHARLAREAGVMLTINTDAHAPVQLQQIEYGIKIARRAWVRAADVLNTKPLPSVRRWIARKRAKA